MRIVHVTVRRLGTVGVGDSTDVNLSVDIARFLCGHPPVAACATWSTYTVSDALERQHLKIVGRCEFQNLIRSKANTIPCIDVGAAMLQSAELKYGKAAGFHDAPRVAKIREHDVAAGMCWNTA